MDHSHRTALGRIQTTHSPGATSHAPTTSPVEGLPSRGGSLSQALQQSRSGQASPIVGGMGSYTSNSPRSLHGSISSASATESSSRGSPATTPRNGPYPTLRHNSTPQLPTTNKTESPSDPAAALTMDKRRAGAGKPDEAHMFRTSSMDSTVSSMSSATNLSHSSSQPDAGPSAIDIASMIASAGSAENLIRQLLKEKRSAAMQNNQLFKLLNKQKSMMQGMHGDLEKALADKERYRKACDQFTQQQLPITPDALVQRKPSPAISTSSVPSTSSVDLLPIQRFSELEPQAGQVQARPNGTNQKASDERVADAATNGNEPSGHAKNDSITSIRSEDGNPKRNTVVQIPADRPVPLQLHKKRTDIDVAPSPKTPKTPDAQTDSTRGSFTQRRSMTQRKGSVQQSNPSSPTENVASSPGQRKAPPAPLNLHKPVEILSSPKSPEQYGPHDHSDSDYEELEVDELPTFERGRKKTRDEDDQEREVIMIRAQRASRSAKSEKSRSKSSKKAAKSPAVEELPKSPSFTAFNPPDSPTSSTNKGQTASLAGLLSSSASQTQTSITERIISPALKSPGLPVSPRPIDRPLNAAMPRSTLDANCLSTSPRPGLSPPLSPRPPRHPIPLPSNAPSGPLPQPPMSAPLHPRNAAPHNLPVPQSAALHPPPRQVPNRLADVMEASEPQPGAVYHGLVSDAYPDLLLPPNALPSILVKVTSSRLRPSRQSTLGVRNIGDESVFTLGIFARSNHKQLWRVEKAAVSLVQLEHQLKQMQPFNMKVPDRSLFTGHAPARVDARRIALEGFFETLLDTPMTEKAAVVICKYFSTQAIPAEEVSSHHHGKDSDGSIKQAIPEHAIKEGYLTKKGKNFGGWKARYFVLNDPILRYYESPGGTLLGTIKLTNAQIGRQSAPKAQRSPSRGRGEDDTDGQYRHAFLIMEPKRSNSSNMLQHVLCAESDTERDEWVEALMSYLGKEPGSPADKDGHKTKPTPMRTASGREKSSLLQTMMKEKKERPSDASEHLPDDALRGVSYETTTPGQAPSTRRGPPSRNAATPPPTGGQAQSSPGGRVISGPKHGAPIEDATSWGNREPATANKDSISGPKNGAIITDVAAWGNKGAISAPRNAVPIQDASQWGNKHTDRLRTEDKHPAESPRLTSDKDTRKRSFWGFRGNNHADTPLSSSLESNSTLSQRVNCRPVFGIPLAEAVEYCMAADSPVCLPAVVYRCLEYLEARGAEMEEGIFRISGSTITINKLKERFNSEGDVNLLADDTFYDVHAVASLLKLYLRELPERVLTNALYPQFVAIQEHDSERAKIALLNRMVHKLPLPNWTLVQSLCKFLIQVDASSELSKMTVRNICIVFAPTLNLSNPIIAHFLKDFHAIFDAEPEGGNASAGGARGNGDDGSIGIEITAASPRTPSGVHKPVIPGSHDPSASGLDMQYEDVLQLSRGFNGGMGDDSSSVSTKQSVPNLRDNHTSGGGGGGGATLGGPEYGAVHVQRGPGLGAMAGSAKDTKQKRRESSMLMTGLPGLGGGNGVAAQRKNSMPLMREE